MMRNLLVAAFALALAAAPALAEAAPVPALSNVGSGSAHTTPAGMVDAAGNLTCITANPCVVSFSGAGTFWQAIQPVSPGAVTPTVPTSTLAAGGTAQTITPTHGAYICNPLSTTAQGISPVEDVYVNPVTTATAVGNGGTSDLAPGQCWNAPPGMATSVSWIAATTGHRINVVVF